MQITSRQAQVAMQGAEATARELGLAVIIAVVDGSTHLKAFHRMDGAVLGSIDIATRKAVTAALFQCNSEDVWEYCKPGASAPSLELTNGGLAPYGGGIALKWIDDTFVGALGVSGGTIEQDTQIARAAYSAFRALMS
jgi:uncharacterized protein GlcG (DUF336 family)